MKTAKTAEKSRVRMEISSQMVKQKVTDGLRFHRIPEEDYLLEADGVVIYEVPQDVFNLIKTNSDFRRGLDYKIVAGTARRTRKHPKRAHPKLKRMVTKGLVTWGIPPRTPTV